jgi:hypothetical protein
LGSIGGISKETDTLILKILGMITVAVCLLALLSFFTDLKFNHLFFKIYLYGKGLLSPFCLLIYFLYEKNQRPICFRNLFYARFVPAGFRICHARFIQQIQNRKEPMKHYFFSCFF